MKTTHPLVLHEMYVTCGQITFSKWLIIILIIIVSYIDYNYSKSANETKKLIIDFIC